MDQPRATGAGKSRGAFIRGVTAASGIAAAAAAGLPSLIRGRPSRAAAAAAADALVIGVNLEITGTYAAFARNEQRGIELATDEWNGRGGLLGRKIELSIQDNNNNPGTAVIAARKQVQQDKAVALLGTINSAASIAVSNVALASKVPFVDTGGHADAVTTTDCHWTTFRTCHSTHAEAYATGFSVAKKFGKKWYLLVSDYAYGHALVDAYQAILKQVGGTTAGIDYVPLGTSDFSSYITKIPAAKPDCILVLINGTDQVDLLKQAQSSGLFKRFPIAGPQIDLEYVWALPKAARVGYWGVEWYYTGANVLGTNNRAAESFVSRYRAKHNEPPTAHTAFAYISASRLYTAIDQAKSTDAVKIVRAMAGVEFDALCVGKASYSTVDHQLRWPMWFGSLRANGTPHDPLDVIEIVDVEPPDRIDLSPAEAARLCKLNMPS